MSRSRRVALPLALLCCLGACSTPETSAPTGKLSDVFATPDWAKFTSTAPAVAARPVTPNDLVSADGRCALPDSAAQQTTDGVAAPEGADAALSGQAAAPSFQGGVALGMTECEVLQRTGSPERFDIGAEGTERIMTMTVTSGANPGLYRFRSGRLSSVERVEVPAPQRAVKPKSRQPAKKSSNLRGSQQ